MASYSEINLIMRTFKIFDKFIFFLILTKLCFGQDCLTPELCYSQSFEKLQTSVQEYNYGLYLYEEAILTAQDYFNTLEIQVDYQLDQLTKNTRKTMYNTAESLITKWQNEYHPELKYMIIVNKQSQQCLTATSLGTSYLAFTFCSADNYNSSHKWRVFNVEGGPFVLRSSTNLVIELFGSSATDYGVQLQNWNSTNTNQEWQFMHVDGEFYILANDSSNLCLAEGIPSIFKCNWTNLNQQYDFISIY